MKSSKNFKSGFKFVLGTLGLGLGLTFACQAYQSSVLVASALAAKPQAEAKPQATNAIKHELMPHRNWSFTELRRVPVQSGGRIKPLDTLASEIVLFETGKRKFENWDPLDLMLSWISFPHFWESKAFIQVTREDVKRQLGLDEKRTTFSPKELLANPILLQYAEKMSGPNVQAQAPDPMGSAKSNPRDQEFKAVFDRISTFHGVISGEVWHLIPRDSPRAWGSLLDENENVHQGAHRNALNEDQESENLIKSNFVQLLRDYQAGDTTRFSRSADLLRASVEGEVDDYESKYQYKIGVEVFYNQVRPFLFAWIFYLSAFLAWSLYQLHSEAKWMKGFRRLAVPFTVIALSFHVVGFASRCYIAGRPPVTNMYESVIWVSLGAVVFSVIIGLLQRHTLLLAVGTALATFGMIVGDIAPSVLDPSIHPLVPVLRSNYWLTIHVLTITLGYAAFALTLGLSNLTLLNFLKSKKPNQKQIASLNQMTYRAMQFGVVFIAAGTILGGVWADYSWGRFWGWDPKEVWALITLLSYVVVLHGRLTGWMGQLGFAVCSAIGFMSVVMAWYGVNFILGVGLHSYGFASGGTPWVLGFVGAELVYVTAVTLVCKNRVRLEALAKTKAKVIVPVPAAEALLIPALEKELQETPVKAASENREKFEFDEVPPPTQNQPASDPN